MAFQMNNTTTYNMENVLRQNILNSDYYNKTCLALSTFYEVVDEIYETVSHVEPWMSGNARGPSTAFCLLHRLCTLNLTERQVIELLKHKDSPYIRAVGFLFLRYVADTKTLWNWCQKYVEDEEEFSPSPEGKTVTMGDFVRDLLLEQYYFETIFPRIPKPVMDNILEELKARRLPTTTKGNGGAGGPDRRGVDDGSKRPASVKASLSVAMGQRAPNRSGAREDRQAKALAGGGRPIRQTEQRTRSKSPAPPPQQRDRDRDRDRNGHSDSSRRYNEDRDRDRAVRRDDDRQRDYRRRDDDRDRYSRDEDPDRYRRDDRDRDRERSRHDERGRDVDRARDARRSRSRSRDRREAVRRSRSRSREDRRERRRSRSRSRSRERRGNGSARDTHDVFKESARQVARDVDMEDVRSRYL